MFKPLRWIALLLALALVLPVLAQETGKDAKTDKKDAKDEPPPKPKLIPAGKGVTTIVRVDNSSITFKVAINKDTTQDVTLQFTEDVKIRTPDPPDAFDEKGNFKKYTPKELDELKGPDKTLPGYPGTWESLRAGQVVQISLAKRPGVVGKPPARPPVRPPVGKPKEGDQPPEQPKEKPDDPSKPLVTMVVVLQEPKN